MHTQRVCILTAYAYSHSHICLIFLRRTMRAVIRASVVGHLRNAARSVHTAKQSGSQPVFKGVVFGLWGVSISSSCVYGTRICVWVFTHTGACIFKCVRSTGGRTALVCCARRRLGGFTRYSGGHFPPVGADGWWSDSGHAAIFLPSHMPTNCCALRREFTMNLHIARRVHVSLLTGSTSSPHSAALMAKSERLRRVRGCSNRCRKKAFMVAKR